MNNDIIETLAKEIDSELGYHFTLYYAEDLKWEKMFAEAIINKCAAIACYHCRWHGHTAAQEMKQHFGMEETK